MDIQASILLLPPAYLGGGPTLTRPKPPGLARRVLELTLLGASARVNPFDHQFRQLDRLATVNAEPPLPVEALAGSPDLGLEEQNRGLNVRIW